MFQLAISQFLHCRQKSNIQPTLSKVKLVFEWKTNKSTINRAYKIMLMVEKVHAAPANSEKKTAVFLTQLHNNLFVLQIVLEIYCPRYYFFMLRLDVFFLYLCYKGDTWFFSNKATCSLTKRLSFCLNNILLSSTWS